MTQPTEDEVREMVDARLEAFGVAVISCDDSTVIVFTEDLLLELLTAARNRPSRRATLKVGHAEQAGPMLQ